MTHIFLVTVLLAAVPSDTEQYDRTSFCNFRQWMEFAYAVSYKDWVAVVDAVEGPDVNSKKATPFPRGIQFAPTPPPPPSASPPAKVPPPAAPSASPPSFDTTSHSEFDLFEMVPRYERYHQGSTNPFHPAPVYALLATSIQLGFADVDTVNTDRDGSKD